LSVFCSSNVSIDEGMFGFSIGASKIHERFLNCYTFFSEWYVCKKIYLLGILIHHCITCSWLTMPCFVDTSQPQGRKWKLTPLAKKGVISYCKQIVTYVYFLWYSLMMYIKSIHYCPVHQLRGFANLELFHFSVFVCLQNDIWKCCFFSIDLHVKNEWPDEYLQNNSCAIVQ
jgi:hypothetical protein